jgi:hypothetical protein
MYYLATDTYSATSYRSAHTATFCCIPPPERSCEDFGPGEDWQAGEHDFRRTAASDNSTGDARCLQTLLWSDQPGALLNYSRPLIIDFEEEVAPGVFETNSIAVVAFDTKVRAYDMNASALAGAPVNIWDKTGFPLYLAGMRNSLAYADGQLYLSGGTARSFHACDLFTGDTIWSRNPVGAAGHEAFVGATQYNATVVLGDHVYTTTAAGEVYALNTSDGANWYDDGGTPGDPGDD